MYLSGVIDKKLQGTLYNLLGNELNIAYVSVMLENALHALRIRNRYYSSSIKKPQHHIKIFYHHYSQFIASSILQFLFNYLLLLVGHFPPFYFLIKK